MRHCFPILLLLLLPVTGITAQPLYPYFAPRTWFIGAVGGYNHAVHSGFRSMAAGDISPVDFGTGSGGGFFAGISLEHLFIGSRLSLIGTVGFDRRRGELAGDGPTLRMIDPATGASIDGRTRAAATLRHDMIAADILLRYYLFVRRRIGISLGIGPSAGYFTSISTREILRPNDPDRQGLLFPADASHDLRENGAAIALNDGPRPDATRLGAGIRGELALDWSLNRDGTTKLTPGIAFDYALMPATTDGDGWRSHALQLRLGISAALPPARHHDSEGEDNPLSADRF